MAKMREWQMSDTIGSRVRAALYHNTLTATGCFDSRCRCSHKVHKEDLDSN